MMSRQQLEEREHQHERQERRHDHAQIGEEVAQHQSSRMVGKSTPEDAATRSGALERGAARLADPGWMPLPRSRSDRKGFRKASQCGTSSGRRSARHSRERATQQKKRCPRARRRSRAILVLGAPARVQSGKPSSREKPGRWPARSRRTCRLFLTRVRAECPPGPAPGKRWAARAGGETRSGTSARWRAVPCAACSSKLRVSISATGTGSTSCLLSAAGNSIGMSVCWKLEIW